MHRRKAAMAILALLVALGSAPLQAQKPGKSFVSPMKNFSVVVPNLTFGTRVDKQRDKEGGMVSFTGGVGDLCRIDYRRLPADFKVPDDDVTRMDFYRSMLEPLLQGNRSSLLSEHSATLGGQPALFAVVSFPGGSHLMDMKTNRRLDSVRGIAVFARGSFVYLLHTELAASAFNPASGPPSAEELGRRAETELPAFYATITFL